MGLILQGEIVNRGSRYHDGMVDIFVTKPENYGCQYTYLGSCRGDLVKEHEFQYLTQHLDFLEEWEKSTDSIHPYFIDYIKNYNKKPKEDSKP